MQGEEQNHVNNEYAEPQITFCTSKPANNHGLLFLLFGDFNRFFFLDRNEWLPHSSHSVAPWRSSGKVIHAPQWGVVGGQQY
mgnify:CR=1 FL=1